MAKRMSDNPDERGFLRDCRHVLAYERNRTVWYHSLSSVLGKYGISTVNQVLKLIDSGATAQDGYTTFDFAIDGYPYDGMKDRDWDKFVDEKYKGET